MTHRIALLSYLLVWSGCGAPDAKTGSQEAGVGDGVELRDSGSGGSAADGGGTTGEDTHDSGGPEAAELSCSTATTRIDSAWDAPGTAAFTAEGTWTNGSVEDVTLLGSWAVAADSEGSIAADGTYTAPARNAGPMTVTIAWEGLTAECSVDTWLEATVDLVSDPSLAAAVGAEVPTLAADCAPYVLYPYDQSRIPADFFSPEVQWLGSVGQDTFVITFETDWITLRAITTNLSWTPTGDEWWAVADPSSGSDISMTVLGGDWDPDAGAFTDGLCGDPWPTALTTEYWGAPGAVTYWTPDTSGLWQIDIGAEEAVPWLDQSTAGQCVGCHSSNYANPLVFATTRGSGGYGGSVTADVSDPFTSLAGAGRQASFSALDPTGTRMVRAYYGVFYLDDLTGDVNLGTVPTIGWPTHPNWSPDGRWLAYSSCASAYGGYDWTAYDCDLRVIEVLAGDTWGTDTVLAAAPPDQSYYYPEWSPDSQWLAFTRNTGGEDSYDAVTAELMIMSATGGRPVVLANANTLPNASNSWPRWGPIVGDIGWLAFSSRRDYALRTSGNHQVWVTGVDLAEVALGFDGSAPPVWIPGQSTTTSNHTPSFVRVQPE